MNKSIEKSLQQFHYVNLDIDEMIAFAEGNGITFNERQLWREINLLEAVNKPLQLHMEHFKHTWTFAAMNDFTKQVKRIFTNRRFKASDADNFHFHFNEHEQKMQLTMKASQALNEISKLTVLRNMYNHLEYLQKGINVKAYFQLRSYIEKFGHEETATVLKRKKMDLNNIYKRVDNRPHIDEVLSYEKDVQLVKQMFCSQN